MFLFVFESTRRNEGAKASGLTSMPNHVMILSPLHDYMHDRTRFEPLYGHMKNVVLVSRFPSNRRFFDEIVAYEELFAMYRY